MKKIFLSAVLAGAILASCSAPQSSENKDNKANTEEFQYLSEQFADLKIVRYKIPGWEKLSLQQKKLVYYLTQSGLAGRDMMYDQNYRHNLEIRKALENVYTSFDGNKSTNDLVV